MTISIAAIKTLAKYRRSEILRCVKFGIVGTVGAIADFGILNLGIQLFGLEKRLANTFSFCSRAEQFLLVGYGINQAVFLSLDRHVFAPWGVWGYNLAKVIASVMVLFWNFLCESPLDL